jgi:hypothetical protein
MNVAGAGRWALVTGASSGLGREFALQLAQQGFGTVLVARRVERLRSLAKEIEERFGTPTMAVDVSLTEPEAPQRLHARLNSLGIALDVLVNNAGVGLYGAFADLPWEKESELLALDIRAVVHLTKLFVKDMIARDRGYVMLVGSIAAYQPAPTFAVYSAAKAFVVSFGEALAHELRSTGVSVTVFSPGVLATEFLDVAGIEPNLYMRVTAMRADEAARIGLRALFRGRRAKVGGRLNALQVFLLRFVPRRTAAALAELFMSRR